MKYECKSCGLECRVESNFEPTVCLKTGIICYGWHKVTAPAPKPLSEGILPKLTVEVFDREDCPEWARYALVGKTGDAWFLSDRPNKKFEMVEGSCKHIPGAFDASDWQNSLIKRPEKKKIPDWCKVGAWVWNESQGRFARITAIGQRIQLLDLTEQKGYMEDVDCLKPARVRPWTFEEAPLAFKTKDDVFILLYIQDKQEWGYWAKKECEEYTLAEVAKEQIQLSGSPCGVLEVAEVSK